jgi:hypothetical protein
MNGHDAGGHSGVIPQFHQRGIGLLLDQFLQSLQSLPGILGRPSAPVRLGRDRPRFPPTLQQPTDPCRTDPEKLGQALPRAVFLSASLHDPFPQIH